MQQTDIQFWSYLAQFFLKWKIFQTNFGENKKAHFVFNNVFLITICDIRGNSF